MSDVDEETTVKVVYANISNALETFSCEIFKDKLIKYVLYKWTEKGTEN